MTAIARRRYAEGGGVSTLDELLSVGGAPEEDRALRAARNPEDIGHSVSDRRQMTDAQRLETVRAQLDDPHRNPDSDGELHAEIARLERTVGRGQGAIERQRTPSKPSGATVSDADAGAKLLGLDLNALPTPSGEPELTQDEMSYAARPARPDASKPSRKGRLTPEAPDATVAEPPERMAPYLGEVGKGVLSSTPAGFVAQAKNSIAGMIQSGQEERRRIAERSLRGPGEVAQGDFEVPSGVLTNEFGFQTQKRPPSPPPQPGEEARQRDVVKDASDAGNKAKQWAQETKREIELVTPPDMSTFQQMVWSGITSSGSTLMGIGVGVATRNPVLGAAVAGFSGSAQQMGSAYLEALEHGATHDQAYRSALRQGMVEGLDALPIGVALAPASASRRAFEAFLAKTLKTSGVEGATEAAQQILQDFDAYVTYNPNMTLGEAWENAVVAAGAGFLTGLVIGGAGHAAEPSREKIIARAIEEGVAGSEWTRSGEEVAVRLLGPDNAQRRAQPATQETFAPTHRLDNIPVRAHTEDGEPVQGMWRDAEGNFHEAARAEPIAAPEANATWQVNGVDYDVEVTGKGRGEGTARLLDGQEVPISQLQLEDDAKVLLGLMPAEDTKKKGEGAASAAAPNSQKNAPQGESERPAAPAGTETESPPPRGSRRPHLAQPELAGPLETPEAVKGHNAKVLESEPYKSLKDKTVVFDSTGAIRGYGPMVDWSDDVREAVYGGKMFKAAIESDNDGTEVAVHGSEQYKREAEPAAAALRKSIGAPNVEERKAARAARMRREGLARKRVDVDKDTLTDAIIKLGGLNMSERSDVAGDAKGNKSIPFVGHLFTKNGTGLDDMARLLAQHGYVSDESDLSDLTARIRDELAGIREHFSTHQSEAALAKRAERERPDEDEARMALEAQAAVDVPLEHNVAPEEFDGEEDFGPTPARLAAVDLLRQLPEEVGERIALEHAESTEDEFVAALEQAVKEQNGVKEPESKYPAAPEGGVRKPEPEGKKRVGRSAAAGGARQAESTGGEGGEAGPVRSRGGPEVEPKVDYAVHPKKGRETPEQWVGRIRAAHPNDWVEVAEKALVEMEQTYGERAERYHELKGSVDEGARTMDLRDFNARITELRAAVYRIAMRAGEPLASYDTGKWVGEPIVGTIKWTVMPKEKGAFLLATGEVAGKVVARITRPQPGFLTLAVDGWQFPHPPNLVTLERAQLVAHRIIRPEPMERVREPAAKPLPEGTKVRVKAVEAESGREIELDEDAKAALADVDDRITRTLDLLECVRS